MATLLFTQCRRFRPRVPKLALAVLLAASAVVSCARNGTTLAIEPPPNPPRYTGRISTLFDDSVSPRFVNPAYAASVDKLLQPRLFEADAVVKGLVRTVDAETRGGKTTYRLGLDAVGSVAGNVPDSTLSVVIAPENPAYGMIRTGRQRLVGQRAIVIVKYFEDADRGTVSHFRIEPDDQTTRDALAAARL